MWSCDEMTEHAGYGINVVENDACYQEFVSHWTAIYGFKSSFPMVFRLSRSWRNRQSCLWLTDQSGGLHRVL